MIAVFSLFILLLFGQSIYLAGQTDLSESRELWSIERQPPDKEIDEEFHIDRSNPNVKTPTIQERIERSAAAAGFELVRVETFLPKDLIFILRPKD